MSEDPSTNDESTRNNFLTQSSGKSGSFATNHGLASVNVLLS